MHKFPAVNNAILFSAGIFDFMTQCRLVKAESLIINRDIQEIEKYFLNIPNYPDFE